MTNAQTGQKRMIHDECTMSATLGIGSWLDLEKKIKLVR